MDTAIVKFNALTNANRSTANNYCFVFLDRLSLILLLIGAIEVGGISTKLSGTGIHYLINGADIPAMTQLPHLFG
ncbi:hypothetical protein ES705_12030 [subsurface metagenome]